MEAPKGVRRGCEIISPIGLRTNRGVPTMSVATYKRSGTDSIISFHTCNCEILILWFLKRHLQVQKVNLKENHSFKERAFYHIRI